VKVRSSGLWPAIAALAAAIGLSSAMTGCIIVSDHDRDHGSTPPPVDTNDPPPLDTPMQVAIDADQIIEATPGEGVGIFVEYASGGHWRVWTTCDTKVSGLGCGFDVFATALDGDVISNVKGEGLEGADLVEEDKNYPGSFHLYAETSSEVDTMTFDASPGSVVELEVYLDGVSQPRFVYWSGGGVLHSGAPTNPVDFKPQSP